MKSAPSQRRLFLLLLALGLCISLTAAQTEDYDDLETEPVPKKCNPKTCGNHAICDSGSPTCVCVQGYQLKNGSQVCENINECESNPCGNNAYCYDIPASYECLCNSGFQYKNGSQHECEDIDECKKENTCNSTATCINTYGSFICVTKNQACINAVRSSDDCSERQTLHCNFTTELRNLCNFSMSAQSSEDVKKQLTAWLNLLDHLVGLIKKGNKEERHRMATVLMEVVESWLRERAQSKQLPQESIRTKSSKGTELAMEFRTARSQSSALLVLSETQMDLNWQAAGDKEEAFNLINLLTYQGLEHILTEAHVEGEEWKQIGKEPKWAYQPGEPSYQILSKVTAAFVDHNHTVNLNIPVHLSFSYNKSENKHDHKFLCAFWKTSNGNGNWSTEGCSLVDQNGTHAHCRCNHLTSFAVLLAFYKLEDRSLDVITKLGLVISLICLFLAILTFLFCRTIRGIRTTIHLNLCLALFAAYVIFLMGVDHPENKIACRIVAVLLHYFFLSVFCWMFLEGVELYLMVVQVFKTHSLNHWHIFLVGYGLPAFVVGITAAVNLGGYGTESYCWISIANGFLWSFLAPVCIIITFNAVVFVVTVWKLTEKFAEINPDIGKLKKQRVLTITAIAQLCILGLTWSCGLFQLGNQTIVLSYIFTILNTLQGLFIFLLHCLLKKQVRDEYYHMFCHPRHRKGQSSDKYSEFSSSASNTLRVHRSTQESGI